MSDERKGAKSYRGSLVDTDTFRFDVNLRFLFNSSILLLSIAGAAYSLLAKIDDTSRRVIDLEQRVNELQSIHDAEMKELAEELKWYQKNVNPFAKKKKK